jgi:hypothetical protein
MDGLAAKNEADRYSLARIPLQFGSNDGLSRKKCVLDALTRLKA